MTCWIILHNIIVQDQHNLLLISEEITDNAEVAAAAAAAQPYHNVVQLFGHFIKKFAAIQNSDMHFQLHNDLIQHLWDRMGEE